MLGDREKYHDTEGCWKTLCNCVNYGIIKRAYLRQLSEPTSRVYSPFLFNVAAS